MSPEAYEELQKAAAEAVVFLRGQAICPVHEHADVVILTNEGPTTWHGPICEIMEGNVPCYFREQRDELKQKLIEALGTKDMSHFL